MVSAISEFYASVVEIPSNSPLSGCKLAVVRGAFYLVEEGIDPLLGVAVPFPEDCTVFDLLEAIDLDGESLEQALACVGCMASGSSRGDRIAARKAAAHALTGFMDVVTAVRLEGEPLEAA
ncbi:hypothetical protein [Shinella sp.]|uniref:hypothetical protein n=1 Tax=Shinella sp. TaxID=1870904 RepID=UPI00258748E4|nr:hypothetical protein [Shinella sp.]MCW5710628.1 hypothetical protein [Shinella sp.]